MIPKEEGDEKNKSIDNENKKEGEEEGGKEKEYENINYANMDKMSDVTYSPYSIDFIFFTSVISIFLIYIWWSAREEKIFKKLEFIRWGGIYDRRTNLKSLLRLAKLDDYGIKLYEPLVKYGAIDALIPCLYENDDEVIKLSLRLINILSKSDFACEHMIRKQIINDLRRHIHLNNDHLFFTIYNLCEYDGSIKKDIAKDQYIIESIYKFIIDRDDPISIRPMICLLNSLSKDKESLKYLIDYPLIYEILDPSNFFYVFEPDNFRSFTMNVKDYKGTKSDLKKKCEDILNIPSMGPKPSKLKYIGLRSLYIFGLSSIHAYIRCYIGMRLVSPLTFNERAYFRKIMIQAPFISVLASLSFPIIEEILGYVEKNYIEWESFREVRKLHIAYIALIPIYFLLGKYFSPLFILPSLFPFRYRDNEPPRYPSFIKNELLTIYRQSVKVEFDQNLQEGPSVVDAFFNQKLLISKLSSYNTTNNKK